MLDPRLKLRHLQAIVSLAEGRSMQVSADALARTPSAVSKALGELEDIVGARLFDRTHRGLVPTAAGEQLVAQVQRGLVLLGDAIDRAGGQAVDAGPPSVTLGVLPTAASTLAPGAVMHFQAEHPDAIVRVVEGTNIDLLARLRNRTIDMLVGRLPEAAQMFDLSFEPLYEEPVIVVARPLHPLVGQPALRLAQVCAYPVIMPDAGTILRATLDAVLMAGRLVRPPRAIETLSYALARQLLARSDAVWFCAPGVVADELASGSMVVLDLDLAATRRAVGLTIRGDTGLTPAAAEFAELLRVEARRVRAPAAARNTQPAG